jgi:hypothetical protein
MVKYLQAPHENELYVESLLTVQSVQVIEFNEDGTRHHTKAFPRGFRRDRPNTQLHCSHDPDMKFSHFSPSFG